MMLLLMLLLLLVHGLVFMVLKLRDRRALQ